MREALVADYPLTKVGVVMFKTDYNRITQPGVILAVRLPGIYADVANTQDAIVNTNFANGQVNQASGFAAAFGSNTGHSRTVNPNEKVYVTDGRKATATPCESKRVVAHAPTLSITC